MYVGRTLKELQNVAHSDWTLEELAYHRDTMQRFQTVLNVEGQNILQKVQSEIDARGGLPDYGGGDYDHPSGVRYD